MSSSPHFRALIMNLIQAGTNKETKEGAVTQREDLFSCRCVTTLPYIFLFVACLYLSAICSSVLNVTVYLFPDTSHCKDLTSLYLVRELAVCARWLPPPQVNERHFLSLHSKLRRVCFPFLATLGWKMTVLGIIVYLLEIRLSQRWRRN